MILCCPFLSADHVRKNCAMMMKYMIAKMICGRGNFSDPPKMYILAKYIKNTAVLATINATPPFIFLKALKSDNIAAKPITHVAKSISNACPERAGRICVPCCRAMIALTIRAKNIMLTYCPTRAVSLFLILVLRYFMPVLAAPEKIAPPIAASIQRFMLFFCIIKNVYLVVMFFFGFAISSFSGESIIISFAISQASTSVVSFIIFSTSSMLASTAAICSWVCWSVVSPLIFWIYFVIASR